MENLKQVNPSIGDFVKIDSSYWYVWDGSQWRLMTVEEQLEVSK